MCRHIYDWNIVNCDVKQQIQLNSTQPIQKYIFKRKVADREGNLRQHAPNHVTYM